MAQSLEIKSKPTERIFTREFVLLAIWAFLVCNNFYALITAVPLYALRILNLTEAEAGLAAGLFVVGMLASRFAAGKLTEKLGFRKMLAINLTCLAILTGLYFVIDSAMSLYLLRIASGFFFGLVNNTLITIASSIIPQSRTGEGIGYYSMIQMTAWAVGPYVSIYFTSQGDYDSLFLYCILMPVIVLASIPFFRISRINETIARNEALSNNNHLSSSDGKPVEIRKESLLEKIIEPSVLPVALVCFFMIMFNTAVTSFVAPYSETMGLSESASSFFIFYTIGLIGSRPIVSKLFDRRGATFVLIPGTAIYVASYLLLAMANSQFSLMFAAVLVGIGLGACQNTTLSLAVSSVPRKRLGFANATYYAAYDSCSSLGPMIAGLIISFAGYRHMFAVAGIWTAIGLGVYFILARRIQNTINKLHD